ncbi:hypothetical protein H310_01958 [Aphanomyces invadans]|uniref:Uncharacterized protein n=1 Tax=Aphanomyces invadans TaxID=157072 RepID=A0A024UME3_9STRA|nr:hypothetical protein H310_01958 [Aphanomyces invadans]ETW07444.1 hypothetical protein H310_01958 [Aphanomyces invadans]|eukprot:XP_008863537.1 hypothetical protein H310_01958 [Aphanomyces invadans]
MLSKQEKGKVEKKGRFTIIDLPPDEPSPLTSFRTGLVPLSPQRGRSSGGNLRFGEDDDDDSVARELARKTRVKQKGRFTIIDLDPNTPSPERGLRKGFRDDALIDDDGDDDLPPPPPALEPQRTGLRPVSVGDEEDKPIRPSSPTPPPAPSMDTPTVATSIPTVNQPAAGTTFNPTIASDPDNIHNPACCVFRTPLMHSQAASSPPPCRLHFDPTTFSTLPPASFVAVPVQQYRDHQDMLAALLEQNKDMHVLIQTLQAQQGKILQFVKDMAIEVPASSSVSTPSL